MEIEYDRLVSDVCNIFKQITGQELDPRREAAAIIPFHRDLKWQNYEFRLIIEYHWSSSIERPFLDRTGNCNLRSIFNPSRTERLKDILSDLKRMDAAKKKYEALKDSRDDSGMKERKLCCKCGKFITMRFIKVFDENGKSFKWEHCNRDEYEKHYEDALWSGGKCMWPDWYKAEFYNETYLQKLRESKTNPEILHQMMGKLKESRA